MAATPSDTDALPNGPLDGRRWAEMTVERLGEEMVGLVPELAALTPPGESVDKTVYSPWMEPGLETALRARRAETLAITGGETDVCVLATVLGAVDRGDRIARHRRGRLLLGRNPRRNDDALPATLRPAARSGNDRSNPAQLETFRVAGRMMQCSIRDLARIGIHSRVFLRFPARTIS